MTIRALLCSAVALGAASLSGCAVHLRGPHGPAADVVVAPPRAIVVAPRITPPRAIVVAPRIAPPRAIVVAPRVAPPRAVVLPARRVVVPRRYHHHAQDEYDRHHAYDEYSRR